MTIATVDYCDRGDYIVAGARVGPARGRRTTRIRRVRMRAALPFVIQRMIAYVAARGCDSAAVAGSIRVAAGLHVAVAAAVSGGGGVELGAA